MFPAVQMIKVTTKATSTDSSSPSFSSILVGPQ